MAYWSGIFKIVRQLTPLLLKAASTASDVKRLIKNSKASTDLDSRVESIEKTLSKQSELNEQINTQIELLKKLIENSQRYILFITVVLIIVFVLAVLAIIIVLAF